MKIPDLFIPEGVDYERRIKDLIDPDIRSLILEDIDFDTLLGYRNSIQHFENQYELLSHVMIDKKITVNYGKAIIHILEFNDKILDKDLEGVVEVLDSYNQYSSASEANAVFKDKYTIFIYTVSGDYYRKTSFIEAYQTKFGFEEVKDETS